MADTVMIEGREVPLSEVVAGYTRKSQLEADNATLRSAQEAANTQLQQSAAAVEAIERAKNDPQFARNLADSLAQVHAGSAFFRDTEEPPTIEGAPVVTPPAPAAAPEPNLELAREVEQLRAAFAASQNQAYLDAKKTELKAAYPAVDIDEVLKRAISESIPLQHLDLLASDFERARLSSVLAERKSNNDLLDGLLMGGGGDNVDENLAGIGSGLSAQQVKGDAGIDYSELSTADAVALAFAQVGNAEQTV